MSNAAIQALAMLVELKEYKEQHGADDHYLSRKDSVWQCAKDAIAQIRKKDPIFTLHVDDWLDRPSYKPGSEGEIYAKFMLDYARLPAWKQMMYAKFMEGRKLFCMHNSKKYRCTGASRMGDVWLTRDFEQKDGYELRVEVSTCSDWSAD